MNVQVAVLASPSLKARTVSVDVNSTELELVKNTKKHNSNKIRAQGLCESRGGRP